MWKNFKHLLLFVGVLIITGCSDDAPLEEQLKATIDQMQIAAEEKQLGDFMQRIDKAYLDAETYTWKDIRGIVQFQFLRNKNLNTFKYIKSLNIIGDDVAVIKILVALSGEPINDPTAISTMRAELVEFDLQFKFSDQWKLTSASWKQAQASDFL